ncbi:MAG: MFS transporter [Lachnospiraceae bacterium]|jgi:fucose permease|nr:MFS transporter [Lachnospiraceae bacterium]MCH4071052.1 MFS transporter [Lachnospiraceae bacterium]MCH4108123.1 MFS transporter [Lachnospiraceae bacterium]MCI1331906.1 MFS transporter [Lachnospiraceae bacterium]MCI1360686.1 MFS transporter [Lachnospiraceae bacterium]
MESSYNKLHYRTGMICFFLSGIGAISSGVVVSLLRDRYGFNYSFTGTLVSIMSVGNMISLLIAGILPDFIGEKATTLLLCSGYAIGYCLMAVTGSPALLLLAFLIAGIAKGCAANKCTVLTGSNTDDKPRAMNLMNAWFAFGALLCPFLISFTGHLGFSVPMFAVGAAGMLLWILFLRAGLPGRQAKSGSAGKKTDYSFLRNPVFWILTLLLFCQNGAEYTVNGWLVTYYKNEGIMAGALAAYSVTIQWLFTLAARLFLAYGIKIKNTFKALSIMGTGATVMYIILIRMTSTGPAALALGLFSVFLAGIYPMAVASVGKMMSSASVGVLLSIGGLGGIIFPWFVGIVADNTTLRTGMAVNIIPCVGVLLLSLVMLHLTGKEEEKAE